MLAEETYLESRWATSLGELQELLSIPSISALPEYEGEVARAADWVAARLKAAGVEHVRVLPTGGHPVVYGDHLHAPGAPTILIYGHFDVQPVDPLGLWETPPFEPRVRDGRIYARGASDMKGNLLESILGVEGLLRADGALPVNVKLLLEGQEEVGSPQLPQFVEAHRSMFACDLVVSADGGQWAEDQPELLLGLKGLTALQIDVRGPNTDLHSGIYGGVVVNPIHALVRLLDSMRGPDGRIAVDGFYDDVVPLSDADRAAIARVPFGEEEYKTRLGVRELGGEAGYMPLERAWARPTLEMNGIWGGFQGEGSKTVLPSEAHAKVTCRLVPDQEPARIAELIASHVERVAPKGVDVTMQRLPGNARPYLIPADHWGNEAAREVLSALYGKQPYQTRSGGSVPVCEIFLRELEAYTVSFGFGLDDEQFHAPNEFLRLASFERGQKAWAALLRRLGERKVAVAG